MRIFFPSLAILLCSCSPAAPDSPAPTAQANEPPVGEADAVARIDPGVFEPYDKAQFPELASRFGDAWERIQPLREGAARQALASGRCDRVELAEISNLRSQTMLVAFADCTNRERFYVSEADLSSDAPVIAQSQRTIGREQALQACRDAARSLTTYPSLADMHTWAGSSFHAYKTTGNARVVVEFDAANAFGTMFPYTANCIFAAGSSTPEITIQPRL